MVTGKSLPTVVGVYETRVGAEDAVAALKAAGLRDDEIELTSRDWDGWYQVSIAAGAARPAVARYEGNDRVPVTTE
jgi:hypothetical protein